MWISNTSSHSIICLSYSLHGAFWRTEVSALFFFKSYLNFSWLFTFPYKYGDEFVNFHLNCLHGMYRLIWEKIDIFTSSLIELFYPPPWHIFYFQSWVNSIFVVKCFKTVILVTFLPRIKVLPAQNQTSESWL